MRHTLWRVGADVVAERSLALVAVFAAIPTLYIADGHHRAASATRARAELDKRDRGAFQWRRSAMVPEFNTMLAVAFPHDHMQILAYNRAVKDLGGLSPELFMAAVHERFSLVPGPSVPARRGEVSMYLDHQWHTLRPRNVPDSKDAIASLDVRKRPAGVNSWPARF